MTRGRRRNTAYAALDTAPDEHGHGPTDDETWTDRDLLAHILANTTAERSAHQSIADELDKAESLATLVAEYETIAAYGHDLAAVDLIYAAGWPDAQTLTDGEGFRPVAAALRAAHTRELATEHLTRHLATIAASNHGTDAADLGRPRGRGDQGVDRRANHRPRPPGPAAHRRHRPGRRPRDHEQPGPDRAARAGRADRVAGQHAGRQAVAHSATWMTGPLAGIPDDPTARARWIDRRPAGRRLPRPLGHCRRSPRTARTATHPGSGDEPAPGSPARHRRARQPRRHRDSP